MTFAEMMFYAEAEGMLPTRQGKINKLISKIKEIPSYSISENTFNYLCYEVGLNPNSLTYKEINYITKKIKS